MSHASLHRPSPLRLVFAIPVALAGLAGGSAEAAPCADANIAPRATERDPVLAEARSYAARGQYAEARTLFRRLTERDPRDQEAWLGAAQVDAWEGCYGSAEQQLRAMLERNAHDVEARAALVDVLVWDGRMADAQSALEYGLATDRAPPLLTRKARFLYWQGDHAAAIELLDEAAQVAPLEEDYRVLRDRLFVGQLRGFARVDAFPSTYANLYSAGAQFLTRARRWEFTAGTLLQRYLGAGHDSDLDGRHTFGVLYHPALGVAAGVSLGFGLPAHTVPNFEGKLSVQAPLGPYFTAYFSYALWQYRDNKTLHIFGPAVAYSPHDAWTIELRWWSTYLVLHTPPTWSSPLTTGLVNAVTLRATYRASPPLLLGASYTYGVQLDENPAAFQLIALRSHTGAAFLDWMWDRHHGLQPSVSVERRESPGGVIAIVSVEAGAYVRW